MKDKILYISYDGMTDALGQSQVIPYLQRLSMLNYEIHILSAEKKANYEKRKKTIENLLTTSQIHWHTIQYTKKPPILSTLLDVYNLKKYAITLHNKYNFSIIHCRSYIAAIVGLYMKKKYQTKFLFDMRGFYADERVDANVWKLSNPLYNAVYKYFKKKEKQFLSQSDAIISLTYAGKQIIHTQFKISSDKITVIPCCADLEHFNFNKLEKSRITNFKHELQLGDNDFVISYLGSIGTWYMLDEMLEFFSLFKQKHTNSKILFISFDTELIISTAKKYNIAQSDLLIRGADREDVPYLLALSQVSLFFIRPVFSKQASSPTKLAEILGMGIPVICNSNVGDINKFFSDYNLGIAIEKLNHISFMETIDDLDKILKIDADSLRQVALKHFSVEDGSRIYSDVYSNLLNNEKDINNCSS